MTAGPGIDSLPMTQAQFGELCGLSQQAVSLLQARGVLVPGQSGRIWLQAYCSNLREAAADRSADSPLAAQRTRLASEQADRLQMANTATRKQLAPVALLDAVLAYVVGDLVSGLGRLVPQLQARCPGLPGAALRLIEQEIAGLQSIAARASLNDIDATQLDLDGVDNPDASDDQPSDSGIGE